MVLTADRWAAGESKSSGESVGGLCLGSSRDWRNSQLTARVVGGGLVACLTVKPMTKGASKAKVARAQPAGDGAGEVVTVARRELVGGQQLLWQLMVLRKKLLLPRDQTEKCCYQIVAGLGNA